MDAEERRERFLAETRESYALLGEFVVKFEHLMTEIRQTLAMRIGHGARGQNQIQSLTAELGAAQLLNAYRSFIHALDGLHDFAAPAAAELRRRGIRLVETRNDLIHGTHYVGWASEDEDDFTAPAAFKLKQTSEGARNREIDISHEALRRALAECADLQRFLQLINLCLGVGEWDRFFERADGKVQPRPSRAD